MLQPLAKADPAISATRKVLPRTLAKPATTIAEGVSEARTPITAGNWNLCGALPYYAFDNAVLWAGFHAYGRTPAPAVIMMGYLVGSLAGALPLPAGLGAVDGSLIAALVLYGAPAGPAAAVVLP
jgi:Lysylphosphatidylglycerol synthase TM region